MKAVGIITLASKQLTTSSQIANKRCFSCCKVMLGHYDTLGIPRSASMEDVKQAYIEKCKLLHPDVNVPEKEMHDKFIEVNEAYSVLGNVNSRRIYDNLPAQTGYPFQDPTYNKYTAHWNESTKSGKARNEKLHKEMKLKIIPLSILVVLIHFVFFVRYIIYSPNRKKYENEVLKQENAQYLIKQQRMLQAVEAQKASNVSNDGKV